MDILSTQQLFDAIIYSIDNNIPSSFIRIGDGEAIMMGYGDNSTVADIKMMTNKIFGNYKFTDEQLKYIKNGIIDSCYESTIIGIPTPQNKKQKYHGWVEDILVKKFDLLKNDPKVAYASFHRNLQEYDLYKDIISKYDDVYCISGRDIGNKISNKFGVNCNLVKIPPQSSDSNMVLNNHPDIHLDILKQIREKSANNLWLVGAGFYGKIYCTEIKKYGGIAIDVGSVIDAWVGINSRGYITEKYKL